MSGALLVAGLEVSVPGLDIFSRRRTSWAKLDPGDFRMRRTSWVRQIILHTTKGTHPQHVIPGKGPNGADKIVADFWRGDPEHSAAHIVIDRDGSVACLADLAAHCAYHATTSNDWSVGLELYQERNGGIYEAVLDAAVKLVPAICEILQIPFQIAGDDYAGKPIARMLTGGPDCVGIFGHRDNTDRRGRGDPGDEIYRRLIDAGAEPLWFAQRDDIEAWSRRQRRLVLWGERLMVDGICGPSTLAAMRRRGFANGRELDAAVEAPL
ncbi:MAG: N-acetylmuramoyl-L-alanine amidase [Myxococcota bacterium]|nr:N-acetylmuramoyl-L-alanine amidase [Myxococcota bacterium]